MFRRSRIQLAAVLGALVAFASLSSPARAGLFDCLFGKSAPSQTTYAPPYVPAQPAATCNPCSPGVAVAAPCAPTVVVPCAPSCSPCMPSCSPCMSSCEPSCSPCGCQPTTTYYPAFPQPTVAYRPVTVGYPVTTYRPMFGTYQTRLVPYTTYRPVYVPTISYQPCTSCVSSPCAGSCGISGPCAGSACGVTNYGPSSSGCASCGVPAANAPGYQAAPPSAAPSAPTGKTFEEKAQKPVGNDLKPLPSPVPSANPSSTTSPSLVDPHSRTASLTSRQAIYVGTAGYRSPELPPLGNDVWRSARD